MKSTEKACRERTEAFKALIEKEFADNKIKFIDNNNIEISRTRKLEIKQRNSRIIFRLDEDLMTDLDSDLIIFEKAVNMAKQILKTPPFEDRNFQGEIFLKHGGPIFKERTR